MEISTVITRFAPSPTGYLHIGGLRTALYSYLFARRNGGKFYLRIEDTDRNRFVEGAEEKLKDSLLWAGLSWDNEEDIRQSERLSLYQTYVEQLLLEKKAYRCFCSPERLEEMRINQQKNKLAPKYDRHCLSLKDEEIHERVERKESFVVRFRVPDIGRVEFRDEIRKKVSIEANVLDDQVILKSDGFPTYHLAVVVDDHAMGVTHVIRGEEWLPSTPKHILLYRAFGWDIPTFAHLPLLLNSDRSKLSKRQGDVSVEDYVNKGYLREAIVNYVALLGWNPGKGSTQEFFSLKDLEKEFDLSKVNKAGAVFDQKRLDWMNAYYIKQLSLEELREKTKMYWNDFFLRNNLDPEKFSDEYKKKVLAIEQERMCTLAQVGEKSLFFFQTPQASMESMIWKDSTVESVRSALQKADQCFESVEDDRWTKEYLQEKLLNICDPEKRGEFFWPLRVALTGEKQSPPPNEVAWVIGKEETRKRLEKALGLFV